MHVVLVSFLLSRLFLIVFFHYEVYRLPVPPLLLKDVPPARSRRNSSS